jgi:transketolase
LDSATRRDGTSGSCSADLPASGSPAADRPTVVIANTVKGKGVSFMEDNNDWHQKAPSREQFEQALAEIAGGTP